MYITGGISLPENLYVLCNYIFVYYLFE